MTIFKKYVWSIESLWGTMKIPYLWITGIGEGDEYHTEGKQVVFDEIIEENPPKRWERHTHPGKTRL